MTVASLVYFLNNFLNNLILYCYRCRKGSDIQQLLVGGGCSFSLYNNLTLYCYRCRKGSDIQQLLVGGGCSFSLTDSNWQSGICIPVSARLDGLYDKDQQVKITLIAKKYEDGNLVLTRSVTTIYVSPNRFYHKKKRGWQFSSNSICHNYICKSKSHS